jgi:2-dehydro-3-deoxygluconokinase
MKTVVTFGEIMGRFSTPGYLRFSQSFPGNVQVEFAGAEANVAASLALLGTPSRFVTALPTHAIADACVASLRSRGVDTDHIVRTSQGRLGLYFLEKGVSQRPGNVIYDRDDASVALTPASSYHWENIFADAGWFHVSGITPALSSTAAKTLLDAMDAALDRGLTISCDLNYRAKLWRWDSAKSPAELAQSVMPDVVSRVHWLVAGLDDAATMLGLVPNPTSLPPLTDSAPLQSRIESNFALAKTLFANFPNLVSVATSLRSGESSSNNHYAAMLTEKDARAPLIAPFMDGTLTPYYIDTIVDRVGAGDAFAAGLIHALTSDDLNAPASALQFATAAAVLAHSFEGDANLASRPEIQDLTQNRSPGRVRR